MSETSQLTGPILKALEKAGILCFRMQAGVLPKAGRYIHLCAKGTADILCFPEGRVVWLETKDAKGRTHKQQAEDQFKFQQRVEELGHFYRRITDLGDLEAALR